MIQLLVIADDFPGARDTGGHVAEAGASTKVMIGAPNVDDEAMGDLQVLVVDTETRHQSPQEAYRSVYSLVEWARKSDVKYIYKKTDSALRGNVGAELTAALEASGKQLLHFVPAFPEMKRTTVNGVQLIDGVPVAETALGQDIFNPVSSSEILEILHGQSEVPAAVVPVNGTNTLTHGIVVYDAVTREDMEQIAGHVLTSGAEQVFAGCAGFASTLSNVLGLSGRHQSMVPVSDRLLIACGSMNRVSLDQCSEAERHGAPRFYLGRENELNDDWVQGPEANSLCHQLQCACAKNKIVLLDTCFQNDRADTADPVNGHQVAAAMGGVLDKLLQADLQSTIFIMGGDSLSGMIRAAGVDTLYPRCEIFPGVVLSEFSYQGKLRPILSKSGAFGGKTLFMDVQHRLEQSSVCAPRM